MLGISTAWRSSEHEDGETLLKEMQSLELPGLELDYRITSKMYEQMKPALKKKNPKVLSVHHPFPHPDFLPREMAGGDAVPFSAIDREERLRAIELALHTLEVASDLEAEAVILHLGKVALPSVMERLYALYDQGKMEGPEAEKVIGNFLVKREREKRPFLDSVFFCLEKLLRRAEVLGLRLGIETRCCLHDIPNFEEIGLLLEEFQGSPIAYWHDVGHAQTSENLRFGNHQQYLSAYAACMAGVHLHDVRGYDDHFAPGKGELDFSLITRFLKPETLKIVEVHPKVSREELLEGLGKLQEMEVF